MSSDIDSTVDEVEFLPKSRPTFLTVLCILTFIVSAYSIIRNVRALFKTKSFDEEGWRGIMDQVEDAVRDSDPQSAKFVEGILDAMSSYMHLSIEYSKLLIGISLVVALLSAFGAYLMYQLKGSGFKIYVAAKVIGIVVPLAIFSFNTIALANAVFAIIIGGIFVILYATQRKYMT